MQINKFYFANHIYPYLIKWKIINKYLNLQNKKTFVVATNAQNVRDGYEKLMEVHIQKMAELSKSNNLKDMFVEKELLSQLKEIGKRLQICANSLEDIVIKMN